MKEFFNLQRFADISNTADNTLVSGTSGDDFIDNGGWGSGVHYVTINSGAGDDVIRSYGDNITINAGAGEDDVFTRGYSFEGESEKTARNYKIYGGAGDDILGNYCASYVTIDGGTGNDNISNDSGDFAVLIGGDGDDTIGAGGEDAGTLSAGDTIMAAQEMIL